MANTNYQTIFQMGQAINDMVKQATGRDVVKEIDMGQVTVAQNHKAVGGTASGTIAEFITLSALPLQIIADINPVQDFNGYEYPWAGGGGKNIVNISAISEPATSDIVYELPTATESGNYVLSFNMANVQRSNTSISSVIRVYYGDGTDYYFDTSEIKRVSDNQTMQAGTYPLTGRYYLKVASKAITKIRFLWRSDTYMSLTSGSVSDIMLESGTSATDFAPYINICPITGWTETIIDHTGKNLVYDSLSNANIDGNGEIFVLPSNTSSLCFAKVIKGITYAINRTATTLIAYFNDAPEDESVAYDRTNHFITNTFTAPITGYVAVRVPADEVATFQIEKGTESSNFEPYVGNTYQIEFPSDAGTVYGGILTVNTDGTGELLVTWDNIASYDGEELPGVWISDRDVYEEGTTPTTGAQVVYELDTPLEPITLEASVIESLIGANYVSANTGNVTVNYTDIIEGGGN